VSAIRWTKRGLVFVPDGTREWQRAYAWVPTVGAIDGDRVRVYVAGRNADNLSQVGCFVLDLATSRVVEVAERPVLGLGALGTFDDSAVLPTCVVTRDGRTYLYYTGWMQGRRVPYYASVGLAVSDDGGRSFTRVSRGPLLERDDVDPYMTASAWVLVDDGRWRMWYLSNTVWTLEAGEPQPRYHIRYAESEDGLHWRRDGTVCIDFKDESEYAIARPCVVRDGDFYRMWYSYRGAAYRIGYAESDDGVKWTRRDDRAGIDISSDGWDSEMLEYAVVFTHRGRRHMLYNGNEFGRTGVGLAVEAA
jgi:hypothetical protein